MPDLVNALDKSMRKFKTDSNQEKELSILESLVAEMGIITIAEFVENQKIIDLLKMYGVDFAQGYAIHQPVPLSELL